MYEELPPGLRLPKGGKAPLRSTRAHPHVAGTVGTSADVALPRQPASARLRSATSTAMSRPERHTRPHKRGGASALEPASQNGVVGLAFVCLADTVGAVWQQCAGLQ